MLDKIQFIEALTCQATPMAWKHG